jgi:hypothetical protein
MPIWLSDLIAQVPSTVEQKVRQMCDQARSVLREALRAESRLFMRTPEEAAQNHPGARVPVEFAPGCPAILRTIDFPDDFDRIMLLNRYRNSLEQSQRGTPGLIRLAEELGQRPDGATTWVQPGILDSLQAIRAWVSALRKVLDQKDPLRTVLAINEDFLGVYEYDVRGLSSDERGVNRATIRIYWAAIGLLSEWLGHSVEALTIVVLAHELAHAYTQLGADIEGRRWPAPQFSRADIQVKEGLAQYYTDRVTSFRSAVISLVWAPCR